VAVRTTVRCQFFGFGLVVLQFQKRLINHAGGGERRVLRGMRLRPALSGPRAAHRRRSPGRRGQGVRRPKVIFRGQSQRHGDPLEAEDHGLPGF